MKKKSLSFLLLVIFFILGGCFYFSCSEHFFFRNWQLALASDQEEYLNEEEEATVPLDWYALPENENASFIKTDKVDVDNDKKFDGKIRTLMKSHEKAFEEISLRRTKSWFLSHISTRLSLSASGLIGIGILTGVKSINLIWKRKNKKKLRVRPSAHLTPSGDDTEITAFEIDETMSLETIKKELAPLVEAAYATKRVKDKNKMEAELLDHALKFQSTVEELGRAPSFSQWYVKGFRMEFSISSEGRVLLTTFGGEVRVRFAWGRWQQDQKSFQPDHQIRKEELSPVGKFVYKISQDLISLSDESAKGTHFAPNLLRIGVGIGVSGKILLAKTSARSVGTIDFARSTVSQIDQKILQQEKDFLRDSSAFTEDDSFYELEADYNEKHLRFADHHHIKYHLEAANIHSNNSHKGPFEKVIYQLNRHNFRQGLKKSVGIASYFIHRAPRMGNFELATIRSYYEVSLTGTIGLASLSGIVSAEIFFNRIKTSL